MLTFIKYQYSYAHGRLALERVVFAAQLEEPQIEQHLARDRKPFETLHLL